MNIPEGWPTKEMVKAAKRIVTGPGGAVCRSTEYIFTEQFKAALAAAPTPPAQPNQWQEAVLNECMAIEGCYVEADPAKTVKCLIDWHVQNEAAQEDEPVSEAEALKGGRWINADNVDRLVRELDVLINGESASKQAKLCDIVAQVAAMKAQEDEPVAWVEVKDTNNGPYEFHGKELLPIGKHSLYTSPSSDELRKAAEELLAHLYDAPNGQPPNEYVNNLRAALERKS